MNFNLNYLLYQSLSDPTHIFKYLDELELICLLNVTLYGHVFFFQPKNIM
jgi:hypothetical protein